MYDVASSSSSSAAEASSESEQESINLPVHLPNGTPSQTMVLSSEEGDGDHASVLGEVPQALTNVETADLGITPEDEQMEAQNEDLEAPAAVPQQQGPDIDNLSNQQLMEVMLNFPS